MLLSFSSERDAEIVGGGTAEDALGQPGKGQGTRPLQPLDVFFRLVSQDAKATFKASKRKFRNPTYRTAGKTGAFSFVCEMTVHCTERLEVRCAHVSVARTGIVCP